ncbi:MAG: hypothetical protein ACLUFU_03565 [Bacilli bacterium]
MINISDFNRIRELFNRMEDLKDLLKTSFDSCRDTYYNIASDFEAEDIALLIEKFSSNFYEQNKVIENNLDTLATFLNSQISGYESANQNAEARLEQTASELEGIVGISSSQIGSI